VEDEMDSRYAGEPVIAAMLNDRAERLGDDVAVTSLDGNLSFAEVRIRAASVASGLRQLGVGPGDRVATMLDSTIDYLAAWHGIIWCGAIDVPINTELRGSFLEHPLRDSGARVLFIQNRWLPRLRDIDLCGVEHVVVAPDLPSALTDGVPAKSPSSGADPRAGSHRLADLLGLDGCAPSTRRPEDLLYILYTSGTTGPSKGACYTNLSASWLVQATFQTLELQPTDVGYSMFPLFHTMGRSALVTSSLWLGTPVVLRPRFSARGFWQDIRDNGITWFGYFGAVILFLWRQDPSPDDADNQVRVAFGASAPQELIEPWEQRFGLRLLETYGSTELGTVACPRVSEIKRPTMGKPVAHLQIAIHDDHDEPVAPGQPGEIVARPNRSGAIFAGYWERPAATIDAWQNLWFHSGDIGTLDEDGYLTFRDRKKDMIRRRGENVSSFEVEEAVRRVGTLVECAAYPVPADDGDDEVMIAVVVEDRDTFAPEALWEQLFRLMPRFAVPRYVRVVDELPKTPSQRVKKQELRADGVTPDTFDRDALGIVSVRD
jgi:acyl-CoA synthetase (AMP-forming)/AMP-acid ligase II